MLNSEKIKLGIAPIGWTNDDLPELGGHIPFEQCIKEIAEAGFEGTEIGGKFPKDVDSLLKALKTYNLKIAGQWFSAFFTGPNANHDKTIEAFKKQAQFLKAVGAKRIVISEQGNSIQGKINQPIFGKKPILDDKGWENLVKGLHDIGKIANDMEMKIVYHHHMGTVIQTIEEVKKLMEITDPKFVWLLVDTGHITFAGGDPLELFKNYSDRIAHIHLKDIRANILEEVKKSNMSFLQGVKAGVFTVPGDGCINFKPIFEAIEKINYEGWLIVEAEQDPNKANPLEYAKKARKTIRELASI